MYNVMLDKYYIYRSNIYHIDGKIIVKYCNARIAIIYIK